MCSFRNVAEAFSAGGAGEDLMQSFRGGQVRSIFVTKFCWGEVVLGNCLIVSGVKSGGSPITDLKSAFGSDSNTQRVVYYKLNKSIHSPTIFRWASGTCASGACASGIAAEARRPAEVRNRRRPP